MVMEPNDQVERFAQSVATRLSVPQHIQNETKGSPPDRLRLSFIEGSQVSSAGLFFSQNLITIGRGAQCDVVLEGETISRQHCLIARGNAGYVLQDSSRNGTFLNDTRAAQSQLKSGDRIRIGLHLMTVAFTAAGTATHAFAEKKTKPHISPSSAPCIIVNGWAQGWQTEGSQSFEEDLITLGRVPDNQVVIEADNISRKHLAIERRADAYLVRDLGSINGTLLNKRKIAAAQLHEGDELRVGSVLISVSLRDRNCILHLAQSLK